MNKIILLLICCSFSCQTYAQNTYYLSISLGDNNNSGTEESCAFKTIKKLNPLIYLEEIQFYSKRGDTFIGQIIITH